jgi:acetoin utilization protein AcuB
MLVRDQMTPNPIFAHPDTPVVEAQKLMQENRIRHLPILDDDGKLVGLVTQRSLMNAVPSDLSQFSPFVVNYILAKLQAHNIMVRDLITTGPDVTIEEAARVMADNRIGCLPVLEDDELVGIISDNDLFSIMVDLLGARRGGVRITVRQPDRAGEVARLTNAIAEKGGYLSVFVTYPSSDPGTWASVFKVLNVPDETLVETISKLPDIEIRDIRKVSED